MRFVRQLDQTDCGPACLSMVSSHYNLNYSLGFLRDQSYITRDGVSVSGLREAAEKIGFNVITCQLNPASLKQRERLFPCILHWQQNHFVVLTGIKENKVSKKISYRVADPALGKITINDELFRKSWLSGSEEGIAIFLHLQDDLPVVKSGDYKEITFKSVLRYLLPFKRQLWVMMLMLTLGSTINFAFPFLMQQMIDKGVAQKNLDLITMLLLAQVSLYTGSIVIDIIRNWLILHIGSKISISIISAFLKKLLQLPLKFFDSKMMGDFNQRIKDNEKIEVFLTSQSPVIFFSVITFSVFFIVLWYYNFTILSVYLLLTIIAVVWMMGWMSKRKLLNHQRFQNRSHNQELVSEILNGVAEIKLNNLEDYKRSQWEKIQLLLYHINKRLLKFDQFQLSGFEFINQIKNILITFLAAYYTIRGEITLGQLLSISYIVGQMNSPINQLVVFLRSLQDARLSLERLNEVENQPAQPEGMVVDLREGGFILNNVTFRYGGPTSASALKDVSIRIPAGKVTAIVGASGSGKTTLMKLLLRFYEPTHGQILLNNIRIDKISQKHLWANCGVVMQDGMIFSDSIERNIATADEDICVERLHQASDIANISSYINTLPLKYKTKIGAAGNGLSGGQKQRILIARAVYKDPDFIFFDEATSALDAENEKIIHNNLQRFFKDKTVVIIAHRLSTVKHADQIIVLKQGRVVEQGNHQELAGMKNEYYHLVKNQLELGN